MPIFVDGVAINQVFVDGVEQQSVFVDGVQVYSGEVSFDFEERSLPGLIALLHCLAVDPNTGVFVSLGARAASGDMYAVSSPNGNDFTERSTPFAGAGDEITNVTFGDNRFYATGSNQTGNSYCIDALGEGNWVNRPTYPQFNAGGGIAFGSNIFATYIGSGQPHSSPTAQTWTARGASAGAPINFELRSFNGNFISVGNVFGGANPTAIDTSTNGTSWIRRTIPESISKVTNDAAYSPESDRWVCVGTPLAGGAAYIITAEGPSPNVGWTHRPNPFPNAAVLRGCVYIPGFGFIIVGGTDINFPPEQALIAKSVDGITWEMVTTHPFNNVDSHRYDYVQEHNGKIVIQGNNTSSLTGIMVSN